MDMVSRASGWWSIEDIPLDARTDAWRDQISRNFRYWELPRGLDREFAAELRGCELDGLRLINCVSGPCSGHRLTRDIDRDPDPYVAIQVIYDGFERFRFGDTTVQVSPGDLLIWTSQRAAEFEIPERLHKATVMIPLKLAADCLPAGGLFEGCVLPARTGIAAVLNSHVRALVEHADSFDEIERLAARRTTLELLGATLAGQIAQVSAPVAQKQLSRVEKYILDRLRDPELSLEKIADANGISVRYLYLLFAKAGRRPFSWIQAQRLERCRAALLDHNHGASSISEIAFSWGFNDAGHFSRRFKERFGHSPSAFRNAARKPNGAGASMESIS